MTNYLNDKVCADAERRIARFCAKKKRDFTFATAQKIVLEACEKKRIYKPFYNKETDEFRSRDITEDVAWEYSHNKIAVERMQEKINYLKEICQQSDFKKKIAQDRPYSKPSLRKLVNALYHFNIVDGQSYLALVYFLMQLKYTRGGQEVPQYRTDQKIALFLNGVQRSGKSSMVRALLDLERDYGVINFVNDAGVFENRFEENLGKAHLNFCDEVVPSKITLGTFVKAVDGGVRQLEHKNQTPYNYNVNSNFIFASNDDISLSQRRVSVVKFGKRIQKIIPFETMCTWMKYVMDSLPNFYWHPEMYNVISNTNQTRLNPSAISTISGFLDNKFNGCNPDDTKTIKFNTSQIYSWEKHEYNLKFIKNSAKEAVRDALNTLKSDGYIGEFDYANATTKQYTMNVEQYYKFTEWANSVNTNKESLTKISKKELRNLLAPYFAPIPLGGEPRKRGNIQATPSNQPEATEILTSTDSGKTENIPADTAIKELSIDLETYSDVDISSGVYKHTDTPSFEILLFSYAVNGGEVKTVDLASGEKVPEDIIKALTDDTVIKWAFNANFERICLSAWLRKYYPQYFKGYDSDEKALKNYLDPTSWRCSMIWSSCMGLPRKLEQVCKALNLSKQKMEEGKSLIQYFCHPCEPTKKNGGRLRNLPQHVPEKWETFKQYNKRDVEAELEIKEHLKFNPVPEDIWAQYPQDQKINDRGVKIDVDFVQKARDLASADKLDCGKKLKKLTNIDNPNSSPQLKDWLKAQGIDTPSVDKQAIENLLNNHSTPPNVVETLKLKQQLSKSSVSKYDKMLDMVCSDGRLRGCLQFYGATTTGRWAGRGVQLQNLPQNHIDDLDKARNAVITSNAEVRKEAFVTTEKVNGVKTEVPLSIPDALSQLSRTALIPEDGCKFIVSDYGQIEARVLSWVAGEQWRLDAFKANKDIYCTCASQMFGVPVEKNGQNAELRVKGKIAELALGYGDGENALARMDSKKELAGANLPEIVDKWRKANPKIVELWKQCNKAAQEAIQNRSRVEVGNLCFWCPENTLYIELPSGRSPAYRHPELKVDEDGYLNIIYQGVGEKGMSETKTYGAKLVENIVQGISRDILAYTLQNLSKYPVVTHIHDEVVAEVPKDIPVNTITGIMEQTPSWIEGLPLKAEGYECQYYQKQ